ncbi:MAG: tetratricopeptide repeat protein [Candidatus Hydrogenedentota bacterium]
MNSVLSRCFLCAGAVTVIALLTGCTTLPDNSEAFIESDKAAWSGRVAPEDMVVAVSPVRRSIQVLHSSVALMGAGVDAVVNDRYRRELREVLGSYDTGSVLETEVARALEDAYPDELDRVRPPFSTAGYANAREAREARFSSLAGQGYETVLDLRMTRGLYGADAQMVVRIEGDLFDLETHHAQWRRVLISVDRPLLAITELRDPTRTYTPRIGWPEFTTEDEALDSWLAEDGERFKQAFEERVEGATAGLLHELDLQPSARGAYEAGYSRMLREDYEHAAALFNEALALDADSLDAANGLIVAQIHLGQYQQAAERAEDLTEGAPDYGPGWFNLAWVLGRELEQPEQAREAYERALELDMPESYRLERALGI